MAKGRHLQKLPRNILLNIANFLYIEDIVCLSNTCRRLKRLLPLWLIRGPDVNDRGPKTWESWIPEIYFDTHTILSPIFVITLSMYWQDQGWGLQKGQVWIQLIRPRQKSLKPKIVCENKDIFGVVPHKEEFVIKYLTQTDPIVNLAKPGDRLRIMKNVGGGCWRQLRIKEFKIVIVSDHRQLKWK